MFQGGCSGVLATGGGACPQTTTAFTEGTVTTADWRTAGLFPGFEISYNQVLGNHNGETTFTRTGQALLSFFFEPIGVAFNHQFQIGNEVRTYVPEPGTGGMLGLALVGLACIAAEGRRRRTGRHPATRRSPDR